MAASDRFTDRAHEFGYVRTDAMSQRQALLRELLRLTRSPEELARELGAFPWDAKAPLVILTVAQSLDILRRQRAGLLTPCDIEAWANAIEARDDVGFEPEHEALLATLLFQLAKPALQEASASSLIQEWAGRLAQALGMPDGQ